MNRNFKCIFIFLFFLLTSCTSLHFESSGTFDLDFMKRDEKHKEISVEGEREFFFWGLYPRFYTIMVDKEFSDIGVNTGGRLQIEEYQTVTGLFLTIVSLGLYHPVHYRMTVQGLRDDGRKI